MGLRSLLVVAQQCRTVISLQNRAEAAETELIPEYFAGESLFAQVVRLRYYHHRRFPSSTANRQIKSPPNVNQGHIGLLNYPLSCRSSWGFSVFLPLLNSSAFFLVLSLIFLRLLIAVSCI